jgi:hypothetical protein
MKPLFPLCLAALTALTLSAAVHAATPGAIESAVAEIGRIHGAALACKQPALVSRARNAVQTTAPKTRAYGEIFENATSEAFLAQGQSVCPDAQRLAGQLTEAESKLNDSVRNAR